VFLFLFWERVDSGTEGWSLVADSLTSREKVQLFGRKKRPDSYALLFSDAVQKLMVFG